MARTKIVCTLGPATGAYDIVKELIQAGMSVARINFAHGDDLQHLKLVEFVRRAAQELGRPIAVLGDLAGAKLRVGAIPSTINLKPDEEVILGSGTGAQVIPLNQPVASFALSAGNSILLADGAIELRVTKKERGGLRCRVVTGGELAAHKGVNLPRSAQKFLGPKELADMEFCVEHGVDYVGLSFVRNAQDIAQTREFLVKKGQRIPLIAKFETREAVEHQDEIVATADGVMVARGDLGVEIPLEDVPIVQKELINLANHQGIPVITATQMLRSMVDNPRPTRAEVTDVANAVLDGSDALMLSEETAIGRYPIEAVRMMERVASRAETQLAHREWLRRAGVPSSIPEGVSHAACLLAYELKARAIIVPTQSGSTARLIARHRPAQPILALSPDPKVVHRLEMSWGVEAVEIPEFPGLDELIRIARDKAQARGIASPGDRVVITAGMPLNLPGTTNLIWVERI
jgi:pyruvate kinase